MNETKVQFSLVEFCRRDVNRPLYVCAAANYTATKTNSSPCWTWSYDSAGTGISHMWTTAIHL